MAINIISFVEDKKLEMEICSAWSSTGGDAERIAKGLEMNPARVKKEIRRLKNLGVLLDGGKLEQNVEKYLDTVMGNKLLKIVPKHS